MKRWQIIGALVAGLTLYGWLAAGPSWCGGRGQGFRPCPYTPYQCPVKRTCKPFDEEGKIVRVFTETLEEGMHPGMALVLDTKNRGQTLIHLAPVWYLERQEFELKPGDLVRVKGMCEAKKADMLQVVAYELLKGDHVLLLRDSLGRPHWEAWRKR